MDNKGQVYFDAGDGKVSEEDEARYEEALARFAAWDRACRDGEPTARQREHIEQRAARKAALKEQAEALDRTREQEA